MLRLDYEIEQLEQKEASLTNFENYFNSMVAEAEEDDNVKLKFIEQVSLT
jgi:hypothetical protein